MRFEPIAMLLLLFLCAQTDGAEVSSDLPKPGEARLVHFDGVAPKIQERSVELQYDFDLPQELFEVYVPTNYSGAEPFGVFVFIDSQNEMRLPKEWYAIMETRKLISVIPQHIGNDQPTARRMGLAAVGMLKTMEHYRIDPKRVVTCGFSGGARCALHLAFVHSGLVSGDVSICGADFYQPVPTVKAANSQGYGVWPVASETADRAKSAVRFVFITGDEDPRRGNISDIYTGGFAKSGFHALLIDVPHMGHQLCAPATLEKALDYLDEKK